MTSTTIGPVAWRAPETFHHDDAGRQIASVATDVYMLGGLMFEVLTAGRHAPFFWLPTERVMVVRATTSINTIDSATVAGVSIPWAVVSGDDWTGAVDGVERLKALMARCLHVEPSRRPSMDDFLAELDAIRDPSPTRDNGYDGATGTSPSAARTVTPRAAPPTSAPPAPAAAAVVSPAGVASAQLIDMSDASDAVAALQVPADVLNRVCDAMADVADDLGNVTGAQLLRIVVDEGVESSLAMALRRKLNITAPVPRRRVRYSVPTSSRLWSLSLWRRGLAALLCRCVAASLPRCPHSLPVSMPRACANDESILFVPRCVAAPLTCCCDVALLLM
jgi:hypothetical protein